MKKLFSIISKNELIRSGGILFLAGSIGSLIAFLALLYLAKVLGPENFGIFKTIKYLFTFLPFLAGFGMVTLDKYIAEFYVKNKKRIGYLIVWFLKLRIISFLVILTLVFIFREQIAFYFLKDSSLTYLIFPGMMMCAFAFFDIFKSAVLGFQNFRLLSLSIFLTLASAALLALVLSPFGLFYIILGWGLGSLFGNLINIKFLVNKKAFKIKERFDIKKIFFGFSLPMYFLYIPMGLSSIIVPILSLFFPPLIIGYFAFAFMFYFATLLIPRALSFVLLPKVSELNGLKKYDRAKSMLKKAFGLYTPIVLVGIIGVLLFSEWLITFIAVEYLPSLLIFKVLVCLGLIFGYFSMCAAYFAGLGKVKKAALFILSKNILLFIVSFILLKMM